MGATQKRWIFIIALLILIVGGGFYTAIGLIDMIEHINRLELKYTALVSNYNSVITNYRSLGSLYTELDSKHTVLESNHATLESDYDALISDHESLNLSHNVLEGRYSELHSSYDGLKSQNSYLQQWLIEYQKVPEAYYSAGKFTHHSNTYGELCSFLTFEFALPRDYKRNVFDCSESSAYLEWALENAGFNARIATGHIPWGSGGDNHAWVIAYTNKYKVAIEATALTGEYQLPYLFAGRVPGIVYTNDIRIPDWKNYYKGYDSLLENVYQAIRYSENITEWDWWEEGYQGF